MVPSSTFWSESSASLSLFHQTVPLFLLPLPTFLTCWPWSDSSPTDASCVNCSMPGRLLEYAPTFSVRYISSQCLAALLRTAASRSPDQCTFLAARMAWMFERHEITHSKAADASTPSHILVCTPPLLPGPCSSNLEQHSCCLRPRVGQEVHVVTQPRAVWGEPVPNNRKHRRHSGSGSMVQRGVCEHAAGVGLGWGRVGGVCVCVYWTLHWSGDWWYLIQ